MDGVITMTPDVMKKLLEVTGSIEMPEYNLTITADNFVEKVQNEVEVDFDKELNQPKKILADLAPKILDNIFNANQVSALAKTLNIFLESLTEKHILLYSKNYAIQEKISQNGWGGQILSADKDYVSVINSNINGFKTDGVVTEKIEQQTEIQNDGTILDTLTITRKHTGGKSQYDWFNRVNANYQRIYVPKGSKLVSVSGQTREFNSSPLDYVALNFKTDAQVNMEEKSMQIDEESGTRIYEDAGKTVFANWVYVSPQEEVVVRYVYELPFKLTMNDSSKPADTYSLLTQKQSGSMGSDLVFRLKYAANFQPIWKYPEGMVEKNSREIEFKTDLKKDRLIGLVFTRND